MMYNVFALASILSILRWSSAGSTNSSAVAEVAVVIANVFCTVTEISPGQAHDQWMRTFEQCKEACRAQPWCTVFQFSCGSQCLLLSNCTASLRSSSCHTHIGLFPQRNPDFAQEAKHYHHFLRPATSPLWVAFLMGISLSFAMLHEIAAGRSPLQHALLDESASKPSRGSSVRHHLHHRLRARRKEKMDMAAADASRASRWYCCASQQGVEKGSDVALLELAAEENKLLGLDTGVVGVYRREGLCCKFFVVILFLVVSCLMLVASFLPLPSHNGEGQRGFCGLVRKDGSPLEITELSLIRESFFMSNGTLNKGFEGMPLPCWRILAEDVIADSAGPECMSWCIEEFGPWPRPVCSLLPLFGPMHRVCFKSRIWTHVRASSSSVRLGYLYVALSYGALSVAWAWFNSRDNKTQETNPPNRIKCAESGPYYGKRQLVLLGQVAPNDYVVSKRLMICSGSLAMSDPILDLNCMFNFLLSGQPAYGLCMLVAIFGPHLDDLLQTCGHEMFFSSLERGFPVKGIYVVQQLEGSHEGSLSLLVALHALIRRAYADAHKVELLSVALSAAASVFSVLPNAAIARDLLFMERVGKVDLKDFYSVEAAKAKIGSKRFLPSLEVFSLGVAFGTTFQAIGLLLLLWGIGAALGILWWIFRQALFVRSLPTLRGALGFALAFIWWFMAPTRLGGHPDVQNALYLGSIDFSQALIHGCASLRPTTYYLHRTSTLCAFWIVMALARQDFFVQVWLQAVNGNFLVLCLLVLGWISLILQFVVFWVNRDNFNMAKETAEQLLALE